jgi:hypothetical protein
MPDLEWLGCYSLDGSSCRRCMKQDIANERLEQRLKV